MCLRSRLRLVAGLPRFLAVFSHSYWVRCSSVRGTACCECTGSAALADQSPEKGVRCINFTQGMLSFGAVLSPVLIKAGINSVGWTWRAMFAICAIAYAVLLIALLLTPVGQAPKQSLMSTGCGIGGALFPTLMGYMVDSYDFSIAFVMLSITALAAGILCFIVQRKTTQTV